MRSPRQPAGRPLTEDGFWNLVNFVDLSAGNSAAAVEDLVHELGSFELDDIFAFDDALAQKVYALDTKRHADRWHAASPYPFSPDGFLYGRLWVVAQGPAFYEKVCAEPSAMPREGQELEFLLYAASLAYERKTGREYDYLSTPSPETFSNLEGWEGVTFSRG